MDIRTRLPAISSLFTCLSKGKPTATSSEHTWPSFARRPRPVPWASVGARAPTPKRTRVKNSKSKFRILFYYTTKSQKLEFSGNVIQSPSCHVQYSFRKFFLFCNALFRHPYIEIEKVIAVRNYNARLAKIFEIEEYIMGMTINMTDFQLWSAFSNEEN